MFVSTKIKHPGVIMTAGLGKDTASVRQDDWAPIHASARRP
jgi:hypothetical protein